MFSDSHLHLDPGVVGVVNESEVLKSEFIDHSLFWVEFQQGEWMRYACQLLAKRLNVI